MRTRQVAVPLVAAVLGSAITAAGMIAGGGSNGPLGRQQGVLASSPGKRLDVTEIYQRAAPSVVYVSANTVRAAASAFDSQGNGQLALSTGSGYVLDNEGRVITSARVISGVTAVQVTLADGHILPAHVLGKDEESDVAVLAVNPDGLDLHPLPLGDSSTVRPGDQVVAVGNPTGVQATAGTGRISATGQRIEVPGGYVIDGVFATDAVIEPSASGGPLLAADGRVIGVTSGVEGATGFAVPANTAQAVLDQIERGGRIVRPYIGLRGTAASGGVQITEVDPDGAADRAGLRAGDVIETIDDHPAPTFPDLLTEVDRHQPGDSVQLRVLRNGAPGDVKVQLDQRPATLAAG